MLLCILLFISLLPLQGLACPHSPKVTQIKGRNIYRIQLQNFHNVHSWSFLGETFKSSKDYTHYTPKDCSNTEIPFIITCKLPGEILKEFTEILTLEPVLLHQLRNFNNSEFNKKTLIEKTPGDSVAMECMTQEEEDQFFKKYGFRPTYKWAVYNDYPDEKGTFSFVSFFDTSRVFSLDDLECADARHYSCFIQRCSYHNKGPCNTVNLVISTTPKNRFQGKRVCRVFGDPHIVTFDGSMYTYKGSCWYVLAMDALRYKWFVYGEFRNCGTYSTCIESLSLVARTSHSSGSVQIQAMKGFGMNINGEKHFLYRHQRKNFDGVDTFYNGYNLEMTLAEYGLQIIWDGLTYIRIVVMETAPTFGLCGDNDGDPKNDFLASFDGRERDANAFGDVWATSRDCKLSGEMIVPHLKESDFEDPFGILEESQHYISGDDAGINLLPPIVREYACRRVIDENAQLSAVARALEKQNKALLDFVIASCVSDTWLTQYDFYISEQFQICIPFYVLADLADEFGLCISDWELTSGCPTAWEKRQESVRIGCIWNDKQASIVLGSGDDIID